MNQSTIRILTVLRLIVIASLLSQSVVALAQSICDSKSTPFGGGGGSQSDPYLICASEHLNHLGDMPYLNYFKQTKDIDLSGVPVRSLTRFVGSFNGQGFKISSLTSDGSSKASAWIHESFGVIENVNLANANFIGRSILVDINHGIIRNSVLSGKLDWTASTESVGAVAAENRGLISSVSVNASVMGHSDVGGISGTNTVLGKVIHSSFQGNVTGGSLFAGGIVGDNQGFIYDSHATGTVKMRPGVGRGAGGVAGWNSGLIDSTSAEGSIYSEDSAGGIIGRSRNGTTVRSKFSGIVTANENAGGVIGLIEFGANLRNLYATGIVAVGHSGAQALGGDCLNCFFSGKVSDMKSNLVTGSQIVGGSKTDDQMKDPLTFSEFDSDWLLDAKTLNDHSHPILSWEIKKPNVYDLQFLPVIISLDNQSQIPKTLVVIDQNTKAEYQSQFGKTKGGYYAFGVIFLPPGKYKYYVNFRNDGFWSNSWCSLTATPSQPWTGKYDQDLVVTDSGQTITMYASCPTYSGNDEPIHPAAGDYLSKLPSGTMLFFDDFETQTSQWEGLGKRMWNRVEDTKCAPLSTSTGHGVIYYGVTDQYSGECNYYQSGVSGIGRIISQPIAGVEAGTKISFDQYWDFGKNDSVKLQVYLEGHEMDAVTLWQKRVSDQNDRKWQKVELTVPYLWFSGRPIRFRFEIITASEWDKLDHIGWMLDNFSIVR